MPIYYTHTHTHTHTHIFSGKNLGTQKAARLEESSIPLKNTLIRFVKRARSQRSEAVRDPPRVDGKRLFRTCPICERGSGQSWGKYQMRKKVQLCDKQRRNVIKKSAVTKTQL